MLYTAWKVSRKGVSMFKRHYIKQMQFYGLEGVRLENTTPCGISAIHKCKLDVISEHSQSLTSNYLNKMSVNELINCYRDFIKTGVVPKDNLTFDKSSLSDYFYSLNKQENRTFIYLPEFKCFIYKDIDNLFSSIRHYYFLTNIPQGVGWDTDQSLFGKGQGVNNKMILPLDYHSLFLFYKPFPFSPFQVLVCSRNGKGW